MIQAKQLNHEGAIIRRLAPAEYDRMAVSTNEGLIVVHYVDITYCEAMGNYCRIHFTDGRSLVASKALKQVVAILPDQQFIRVHQSYLVRCDGIAAVGHEVVLRDGRKLPVSRSRRNALTQWLRNQMPFL